MFREADSLRFYQYARSSRVKVEDSPLVMIFSVYMYDFLAFDSHNTF